MAVQILIVLLLAFFALQNRVENSILLVVFLLPLHYLLKCISGLFLGSSNIFSLWKEVIFLILFLRVLTENFYIKKKVVHSLPIVLLVVFFILEITLFLLAPNKEDALMSIKAYLFPFLVAFVCSNMSISNFFFKKLFKTTIISVLLVCIIGYLQRYLLSVPFAFLMNMADGFDENGDLSFINSASLILGLQRMYGSFSGPNELGLFLALLTGFLTYFYVRIKGHRGLKLFIAFASVVAAITLIQTFSRVSWAFATLFFVIANFKRIANKNTVIVAVVMLFVGTILFLTTDFGNVLMESITFQESSAQGRPDEFFSGLKMISTNPLGLGLGTVQYASSNQKWGTEIFWWLVFVENGLLVGLLLFLFYLYFGFKALSVHNLFSTFSASALLITVLLGFASVIIFEPIFLTFLWMFVGLGFNKSLIKEIYSNGLIY